MRTTDGKQATKRRWVRLSVLLIAALVALLGRHLLHRPHVTSVPFTYNALQGSVRLRVRVAEQTRPLEFNSLLTKTALGRRVYQQSIQDEVGIDRLSPSADFAVGSYRCRLFYDEIEETALHPYTAGVLGTDLFAPTPGFEGQNARPGARLTLDFKTNLLQIEDGPTLEPLKLPKGTLQFPLFHDADGPYYLLLPLNNGAVARFALGIGVQDVLLPTGAVLFPAPSGTGYVNAEGVVPVTLTLDGHDLTVLAVASTGDRDRTAGVLGLSLLAGYRVIVDFRNGRLYLEPADSPAN